MTERDKKITKLLCVLGPVLLLAVWYGYSEIQAIKARKAERQKKAREQSQQAANSGATTQAQEPAAAPGTRALPSPPPGAPPADQHASVPAAAFAGVRVIVDTEAQKKRRRLPWSRDPFTPPDTEGPRITAPDDVQSPRGEKTISLKINVSDKDAGNSGIRSAVLYYGAAEPFDAHFAEGKAAATYNGDGIWTFTLPTPDDKPFVCYIVATDNGRLRSRSRSRVFKIVPPPRETVEAQIGGTDVKLTLRGISWSGESGVALINSDVLSEGEYVQGYQVVKILKDGVVLQRNTQEIFLQLKE